MTEPLNPALLDPIARLLERMNVDAVFGTPALLGDVTIIPVAEIRTRFGFGAAGGRSGSGGAAAGRTRPLGFIRVAADGVQFEPLFDPTRVPMAGIVLVGWTIYWLARTVAGLKGSRGR